MEQPTPAVVILFEDDDLVAIDKPSGLAVHPGMSPGPDCVLARLSLQGLPGLHPIHRLDRPTSGALVLARHRAAARFLSDAFAAREVDKVYWAFVRGAPLEAETLVDHPVPKDEGAERVPARTHIRCLETIVVADSPLREKRISWIEARPETGRFHQIRRHLKHVGCPILGDTTYGRSEHNRFAREHFGLARLALHAARIELPRTSAPRLAIEAPLPADLAGLAGCFAARR